MSWIVKMNRDGQIGMECGTNIRVKGLDDHDDGGSEYRSIEQYSMEGGSQLLVSEYWMEIVWVLFWNP